MRVRRGREKIGSREQCSYSDMLGEAGTGGRSTKLILRSISKSHELTEGSSAYLLEGTSLNAPDVGIVPQRSLLDKSLQQAAGRKSNLIASWKKSLHGKTTQKPRENDSTALTRILGTRCCRAPRVWVLRSCCCAGPSRSDS